MAVVCCKRPKITITGTNDDPQVAAIIEHAANEDDASFTVDLLEGASDIDDGEMATLSVVNVSPLPFGLMLNGNTINVDPSHTAFQHLAEGVDEVITVNYEIEDEQGAKVAQTAKITITGKNDLPEVGAIIEKSANEDDDSFIVDLLEGGSDPDDGETQTLSVANLAGLEAGLVQSGNTVTVDPSDGAFQSLAKDEPYIITLSYDIVDAQGGSTPQTAKNHNNRPKTIHLKFNLQSHQILQKMMYRKPLTYCQQAQSQILMREMCFPLLPARSAKPVAGC